VFDKGVTELVEEIENHRKYLLETSKGLQFRKSKPRVREELADMVKQRLIDVALEKIIESGAFDMAVDAIVAGESDPYNACDSLVQSRLHVSSGD